MTVVEFTPPRELQAEVSETLETLRNTKIVTNDDYVFVVELSKMFRALDKKITDFFTPLKRKQDAAKQALLDAEKEQRKLGLEGKALADSMILDYQTEQARIRREEERRLTEEARKREEDRRLAEAIELAEDGDAEGADMVLAEPVVAPVISLPSVPKVQGMSTRRTWKARLTDKMALIRWVGAHPEYQHLLDANSTALNAAARAMKSACPIEGIQTYEEETLAQRA